jgi:hypothetical protein
MAERRKRWEARKREAALPVSHILDKGLASPVNCKPRKRQGSAGNKRAAFPEKFDFPLHIKHQGAPCAVKETKRDVSK